MTNIVKSIADYFKAAPKDQTVDRYGILSPLLATGDYVASTTEIFTMFKGSVYADLISGRKKTTNKNVENAILAYKAYVKELPSHEQAQEKANTFSTILMALDSIAGNIVQIEDNFQSLFGTTTNDKPETTLRSSSLIVIGYLEKSDAYCTWLGELVEHMTAGEHDLVAPFHTKSMSSKAMETSEFAAFNLYKWNTKVEGLLGEVKDMQKKGSDVAIHSDGNVWIDEYTHDNQFSPVEQTLMSASLRSPILMAFTQGYVRHQERMELLTSRKDWLTTKIILEQSKLRGLDETSPEYKRLNKAVQHYADLITKYEQKIERMHA